MCIIIYKPKNQKLPKKSILKTAFTNNPDGAGLMIKFDKYVYIEKGFMDFQSFYKKLRELDKKYNLKNYEVAIHFRIATAGSVIPANCHPFPVSKKIQKLKKTKIKIKKAIVHNGIIDIDIHEKDISDTMQFTIDILSNIKNMYNYNTINMLEQYIGHSKIVYFEAGKETIILNENLGIWNNSIWYSNSTYKNIYTYKSNIIWYDDFSYSEFTIDGYIEKIEKKLNRSLTYSEKDRLYKFSYYKLDKILEYLDKYKDIQFMYLLDAVEFDYSPDVYIHQD